MRKAFVAALIAALATGCASVGTNEASADGRYYVTGSNIKQREAGSHIGPTKSIGGDEMRRDGKLLPGPIVPELNRGTGT
jgi:hypothetical protein